MTVRTDPALPWVLCPGCRIPQYAHRLARDLDVCPGCSAHLRVGARERLRQLLDPGTAVPIPGAASALDDPLRFHDTMPYPERLSRAREMSGIDEAVLTAAGEIGGRPVVVAAMDFAFLGGSLGMAAGQRLCDAAAAALDRGVPLLTATASGGARMQEGIFSLRQMARIAAAFARLDEAGILTVTLVTDPTYGGVAASVATLADVIIAEPRARMGFAGPRVVRQITRTALPPGFQTAESLAARGLVDRVVPRRSLRPVLASLLGCGRADGRPIGRNAGPAVPAGLAVVRDPDLLAPVDPWERVKRARDLDRSTTLDHIAFLCTDFQELHGDRTGADCPALVGGPARFRGRTVVIMGHQKGRTARELSGRNFGMATPTGYRKAARLAALAAKLRCPLITLVDTPGADPRVEAENGGQAGAIAANLRMMARLPVPIVSVITGEGGSGGALALTVADRLLMLENAVYSVISPEGCAAILWRAENAAPEAAAALRLDAAGLLRAGAVDGVVREAVTADGEPDRDATMRAVGEAIEAELDALDGIPALQLVERRLAGLLESDGAVAAAAAPVLAAAVGPDMSQERSPERNGAPCR
ncbi:carboxyl transferase domain-containing protein [Actinomadura vinacea]|uniref:Acetyl-coenzyme A carboxylase carboxyl transferase subunit beta n=1 Tax=Actinomadura vinacea TaxID=115336 RepID=A0ABN3JAK1_9ACTN